MKKLFATAIAAIGAIASLMPANTEACSRIEYVGKDSLIVIGRSLDWKTPIPTNLYVYPRGMKKVSSDQPNHISWTSRYGAVYAVSYDGGIAEGMNEKGLCINGLFCKGTIYENSAPDNRPFLSLSLIVAWLLDQYATTPEVVEVIKKRDFVIQGATFDGGTASTLHWGVTDAQGRSAIIEFDNGEVKVYDPGDVRVMTNDPQWPDMLAIINYWDKIGGSHMLPGTVSSPDRCVRANFFAHHVEATSDAPLAVAITRSILGNVSVPYTYLIEGEPNVSSTQWKSYSDLRDRVYYFELVTNPGYVYVDLNKCNLREGAPVMKFNTTENQGFIGDISSRLTPSQPFSPIF